MSNDDDDDDHNNNSKNNIFLGKYEKYVVII
jgi:hypothetical protein